MTHDEAIDVTERHLNEALEHLRKAAELLRSSAVDPSPRAMRAETTISRAIEALEIVWLPGRP